MTRALASSATRRLRHVDRRMRCDCTNGATDCFLVSDSGSGIESKRLPRLLMDCRESPVGSASKLAITAFIGTDP